jgi:uncharacterized membrane protein YsdA (DUF1294 family)
MALNKKSGVCLRRVSSEWLLLPANYVNRGGCVGSILGKTVSKHNSSKTPLALRCLLEAILSKHRNRKTSLLIRTNSSLVSLVSFSQRVKLRPRHFTPHSPGDSPGVSRWHSILFHRVHACAVCLAPDRQWKAGCSACFPMCRGVGGGIMHDHSCGGKSDQR